MAGFDLPRRQLVSQQDRAHIEGAQVARSTFINEWTRKTAFDHGYLIPMLVDEVLPGDHMQYDVTAYVRMSTPLFPQFDNIRVDTHFFFVPNRLVWEHWRQFMGQQDTVGASIAYNIPQLNVAVGGEAIGSLTDHMGLPNLVGQMTAGLAQSVNAMPFRAYNLIYNEWFRDQNFGTALAVSVTDGPDAIAAYALQRRNKASDYFTTALPWPQKFTAPTISLGTTAPVTGIAKATNQNFPGVGAGTSYETGGAISTYPFFSQIDAATADKVWIVKGNAATNALPQIYANLAGATGISINTLRQAWLVQQLLERDARGGTRYVELVWAHFKARNPDYRLQRPEYIGGGQSMLNITPIAQTTPTGGNGLGALGGAGTASGTHRASYAATEHGYIIGLISTRSELSYQQGIQKHWLRYTRYDYFWPALAGLGEQAIENREIYVTGNPTNDLAIFGYQERYQEYRVRTSEVTGIMRSFAAGSLDSWHMAEEFAAAPVLNDAFIKEPILPIQRVLAAAGASVGQQFLADILYRRRATRPIPVYGTPATLGRF